MSTDNEELEELRSFYSDIHKDVYGFRPRHCSDELWNSVDALRDALKHLSHQLDAEIERELNQQNEDIKVFEALVEQTIAVGAGDRVTAIKWLDEACSSYGDLEYLCFLHGLSYGYLTPKGEA